MTTTATQLQALLPQVGKWAQDNFGHNETKQLRVSLRTHPPDVGSQWACLEYVAPLLGMGEELGEYYAAPSTADAVDALGDIGIYLLDFLARQGLQVPAPLDDPLDQDPHLALAVYIGQLQHFVLKRCQGIRGMDDPEQYVPAVSTAAGRLLGCLYVVAKDRAGLDYATIVVGTWGNVVAKRDWRANSKDGGGATHKA